MTEKDREELQAQLDRLNKLGVDVSSDALKKDKEKDKHKEKEKPSLQRSRSWSNTIFSPMFQLLPSFFNRGDHSAQISSLRSYCFYL